ncbi:MAG: hypothetical protein HKO59_00850 [Phycisphaerales bacterium]|nr:hypothetical protein [Phycisphaerae bacterium]NNF44373.1 hypothetical protein [Phycisphaerales bacterium]NNM24528.1 hypothetical protein [Phycisphaerales bacterium]
MTTTVHPPPRRRSAWTFTQKIKRVAWAVLARPVWWLLPAARPALLRAFGGVVGDQCRFAASVSVTIPWNVRIGDGVQIGPDVKLYSLGLITIGSHTVIDRSAHLCAGTHDMRDSRFPLITPPITIGHGSFIGVDAYIGPGVELRAKTRVWPRASVYRSFDAGVELSGNPARPIEARTEVLS